MYSRLGSNKDQILCIQNISPSKKQLPVLDKSDRISNLRKITFYALRTFQELRV